MTSWSRQHWTGSPKRHLYKVTAAERTYKQLIERIATAWT
jgi:hypothetical protein